MLRTLMGMLPLTPDSGLLMGFVPFSVKWSTRLPPLIGCRRVLFVVAITYIGKRSSLPH